MPASITSQKLDSDLSFSFRVDDLRMLFTIPPGQRSGPSLWTEEFGPRLSFELRPTLGDNDNAVMGLYLRTVSSYNTPAARLRCKVSVHPIVNGGYSAAAATYSSSFLEHLFPSTGGSYGWPAFLSLSTFECSSRMSRENAVWIQAKINASMAEPSVRTDATLNLLYRCMHSELPDALRFASFGARNAAGKLIHPRSVFAPGDLLTELCDKLDSVENVEILRCTVVDERGFPDNIRDAALSYSEYDSDFEDDDEENAECAENGFEAGRKRKFEELEGPKPEPDNEHNITYPVSEAVLAEAVVKPEPTEGCVIVLQDTAARTWEALLFYLQTGFIVFAPLLSKGRRARDEFLRKYRGAHPNRPVPSSCKSIYRLADKLGLDELKKWALLHLESELRLQSILDEVFSEFTAQYEEVRKIELAAVVNWWNQLQKLPALTAKMEEVASGRLPHAGKIMTEIWSRVTVKAAEDAKSSTADS